MTEEAAAAAATTTETDPKPKHTRRPAPFRVYEVATFQAGECQDDGSRQEVKALVPLKHPELADTQGAMRWIRTNAELLKGKRLEIHQVKDSFTLETEVRIIVKR